MTLLIMLVTEPLPIALAILSAVVIPLSIWGVSVEKKFVGTKKDINTNSKGLLAQKIDIENVEKELKSKVRYLNGVQEKNHKEVMMGLHNIQLELKDKKDRE